MYGRLSRPAFFSVLICIRNEQEKGVFNSQIIISASENNNNIRRAVVNWFKVCSKRKILIVFLSRLSGTDRFLSLARYEGFVL